MSEIGEDPGQAWRRLLRGGFAFETAPFAVHPLDRERARLKYHFALRAEASAEDILLEARNYLEDAIGLGGRSHDERLIRVRQFLSNFTLTTRKRSAWLVYWNRMLTAEDDENSPPVTIIDSRKRPERVADFLEQFYMAACYSLREKVHYSSRPKDNPYRSSINYNHEQGRLVSITCGHNPWLGARFVRNVRLKVDGESRYFLTWDM